MTDYPSPVTVTHLLYTRHGNIRLMIPLCTTVVRAADIAVTSISSVALLPGSSYEPAPSLDWKITACRCEDCPNVLRTAEDGSPMLQAIARSKRLSSQPEL